MKDIAPELYERIKKNFVQRLEKDRSFQRLSNRIRDGTASLADAQNYTSRLGYQTKEAIKDILTQENLPDGKLYWNIAERTIKPMLVENYYETNQIAAEVQKMMDKEDGINIKSVKPGKPDERILQILNGVCDETADWETVQRRMDAPIQNCIESFFDDFICANAEFRYKAGLNPIIIRTTSSKCCDWCKNLAGNYRFGIDVTSGHDVFRRHDNCKCVVTYKNQKESQDVWSKARWTATDEELIHRKNLNVNITKLSENEAVNREKAISELQYQKLLELQQKVQRQTQKEEWIERLVKELGMTRKQASIYYNKNKIWLES